MGEESKIIKVSNLKKSYGKVQAVKGIDFYVEQGKLFAFLGPNGAGKSTTIDMLCTLMKPDSGEVTIAGYSLTKQPDQVRNSIGVVFQGSYMDEILTIRENLEIRAAFYYSGKKKIKEVVEQAARTADVTEFLDRPYGKLSGGQKRRADIARALLNTPKILFLDEPTTGLDPQTRKHVWETVLKLQKETGMTIFLTTHYMEEAAEADYIIIIDDGKIAAKGTPYELKEEYSQESLIIKAKNMVSIQKYLMDTKRKWRRREEMIQVSLKDTMDSIEILNDCKDSIESFEVLHGTMDDVFLAITGKEIRE